MAKTWYLTDNVSQLGKKLGNLTGWRAQIAQILVGKQEDDQAIGSIRDIVTKHGGNKDELAVDQLIPLLPKAIRNKAKILAHHLLKHIKIGGNGQVIYPDGTEGASIVDHLKYLCSTMKSKAPFDIDVMQELLEKTNAPKSCMSTARNKWLSL